MVPLSKMSVIIGAAAQQGLHELITALIKKLMHYEQL